MQIRMKSSGQTVYCAINIAADLIRRGLAEPIKRQQETATAPLAENAVLHTPK